MLIGSNIINRKLVPYIQGLTYDCLFILCDEKVFDYHQSKLSPLIALLEGNSQRLRLIQAGESCKTIEQMQELWQWLKDTGATRQSLLINIGGGTITDLGGFVGATYMRGLKTLNIPTTLLAMVDASVGGKTGINFDNIKNLIGAFHSPIEVCIDIDFLETLSLDELYSGYGEVIKTALLAGGNLWSKVLRTEDPQFLSSDEWLDLIQLSINYKSYIVEQDCFEKGLRKYLNLGHTIGHAIESFSHTQDKKPLLHGEAVVIGLVIELYISYIHFGLESQKKLLSHLNSIVREIYPHYGYLCKYYDKLIALMRSDKKNQSRYISIMGLKDLGQVEELKIDDDKIIKEGLDFYREAFGR